MHPFNKLAYVLLTGMLVYLGPAALEIGLVLIFINMLLAVYGGVAVSVLKTTCCTMLPLAVFMLPIHGCLYPDNKTVLYSWHMISLYREGVIFACTVLVQLTALLTASLLFVFTTHPADFLAALTESGCSPVLAYLIGSPLLLLPAMRDRVGVIQAAQRARGMDCDGSLWKRILAVKPLISPFVLGTLVEIEQRAIALEVRGFNSCRRVSSWRQVEDSLGQQICRWTMIACCAGIIAYHFLS